MLSKRIDDGSHKAISLVSTGLIQSPLDISLQQQLHTLKSTLIEQLDGKGIEAREASRLKWMHLGDSNIPFFANSTREQVIKKPLVRNLDQGGNSMTTRALLKEDAVEYYYALFKS